MPAFLNDENTPIYSNASDILALGLDGTLDPHHEQSRKNKGAVLANSGSIKQQPGSDSHFEPHHRINESFDDSSNSSAHASEVTDPTPAVLNGNVTRPTSMNSLPNGNTDGGDEVLEGSPESYMRKNADGSPGPYGRKDIDGPLQNGNANDAGSVREARSHHKDGSTNSTATTRHHPMISPAASLHQSPTEITHKQLSTSENSPTNSPPPLTTIPSGSEQTAFQTPEARITGHRFSSPPIYGSSANVSSAPNLRQRHTLEVPKPAGRSSRDGAESAFSSGRFSPTTARRSSTNLGRRGARSQTEGPSHGVVPDEDAKRWAEAYRQKMVSKRRRREEEDDDRVLVGTKVDEHHANWVTAYNMLTGIRVSVSRTNAKLDRPLTDADFEAKQKSTFDM